MKILEYTLPVSDDKTIIISKETLPHFYPYLHRHNEVQITWVMKSKGTLVTGNAMHPFTDNEIYWLGSNQSHVFKSEPSYFENNKNKETQDITIFFNFDNQLSSFFSIPEVKHLKQFILQHNSGFRVPNNKVEDISKKMISVYSSKGTNQFVNFIELLKLFATIETLTPLSSQQPIVNNNNTESIKITNVYNYIMQHYNRNITLEEVSKLAYMTPQAFCRYFKKQTRHTLVSFINEVRINEACKKLINKNYESIATVAYNTGFNSITNFNRVFKSIVKKSPKEYLDNYFKACS